MKKFKIVVSDGDIEGESDMSVTHNGHQWQTTWFRREELPAVVVEIQRYLDEEKK